MRERTDRLEQAAFGEAFSARQKKKASAAVTALRRLFQAKAARFNRAKRRARKRLRRLAFAL